MPTPKPTPASVLRFGGTTMRRRALLGVVLLAVLALVAWLVTACTRDTTGEPSTPSPSPTGSPSAPGTPAPQPPPTASSRDAGRVPVPPRTSNPIAFGEAFAQVLWSYDTRALSQPEYLAGIMAWLTREDKYADRESVVAQVPSPAWWDRMGDNAQYATARVSEAHVPSAFTAALNRDPAALADAYVYAVTVSGSQTIRWRDGGRGAEDRTVTLAVQCRPHRWCALAGIAPTVAP